MIEQKPAKLSKEQKLERKLNENQRLAKKAAEVFSGNSMIMIWLVVDGGSKNANIPDNVRMGMPKNDANRSKNEIADMAAKFPEMVQAARKRILEKRRQSATKPERELVPA